MFAAVVVPCYNESLTLRAVCESLGFGAGQTPAVDSILVIVDNGSVDGTLELAREIAAESPPGSVHVAQEPERGYVPPRRTGDRIAGEVLAARGVPSEELLIVQADADTTYGLGYVDAMRSAALCAQPGTMLQSIMLYPDDFLSRYADYVSLCERADAGLEWLLEDPPEQVVVDDKTVAYRLSDYRRWEGHTREYFGNGEEVHAETTRLFMKGKAFGATLRLVEDASATHSVRRLLAEPVVDLATAGFPRERSWVEEWRSRTSGVDAVEDLFRAENLAIVEEAISLRRRHIVALFGLLPLHVARAAGFASVFEGEDRLPNVSLPKRMLEDLRTQPSVFIEDVFVAMGLFW